MFANNPKILSSSRARGGNQQKLTVPNFKKDLKMNPYKVTTSQKLSQKHMVERRDFAAWLTDED